MHIYFNEIIGQDLSVRMLKNSLYMGCYFPVYLFSGQRGCGKTTTARVFAAAVNCEQLHTFRKNPQQVSVPCLICTSCRAMFAGKHPDFIEMDAASHTGVDAIRQVIDAASFLPLMGDKKIYLVDEAHMLSKAAFNALLKILEEPPSSVLFMLATTDLHKIIDTVKSRCFQLFFRPVDTQVLHTYLNQVCVTEHIPFEKIALSYIIQETEGSVRDALNLLEQVRFSNERVTKDAVLQVLGYIDDEQLINLFSCLLSKTSTDVLQEIKKMKLETFASEFIWHRLVNLARALLWFKHGVDPDQFIDYSNRLKQLAVNYSWQQLNHILDVFYSNEKVFLKTTAKHALLEMILLQLCQSNKEDTAGGSSIPQQVVATAPHMYENQVLSEDEEDECENENNDEEDEGEDEEIEEDEFKALWQSFVKKVNTLNDPLLASLFTQGNYIRFVKEKMRLDVEFSKDLVFFHDWLNDSRELWFPLLKKIFTASIVFNPLFTGEKKIIKQEHKKHKQKPSFYARKQGPRQSYEQSVPISKELIVDIADGVLWKKANLVLQYFPGTLYEVRE